MMSKGGYKFVCMDLDGTLLDSNKTISLTNQKAVYDIHQKGISFMVATGRHLEETLVLLKEYNVLNCFEFVIFADGCGIYDIGKSKVLETSFLTNNNIKAILKIMGRDKNMAFYNEKNDFIVFDRFSKENIRKLLRNNVLHKSKNRYLYYPFLRLFYRGVEKQKVVLPQLSVSGKKELKDCGLYVLVTNQATEVMPINKCLAIQKLLRIINASDDEVLYVGDEFNDSECFGHFDSVVMGNAPAELKQYSVVHSRTNDEDGVAYALREIFDFVILP